ncbi:putative ABC transporter permease [Mediterraneibacter agrestimuris]|uniref:putative ABC transporter permease n=1 Tax=Mediterraneibacter agrestimuris TaxID=2941333 RepID=UPI00203A8454|nr:hypothetical protein [Mediterraneibacter agrestimuris]
MDIYFAALYFFVYSFLGWCTEVAFAACKERRFVNRGFLNGPFCPIYGFGVSLVIVFLTSYRSNLVFLYIASVFLVTVLEGLTGWAMDKIFHNKWWDYSDMPLNIGGYVCLIFSLIWGAACVAIMNLIHPLIHKGLTFLPHTLGIVLIILLGILLIADTCVTASAIFKFNRQLEHMEKIAAELHELSEQLGENIYSTTVRVMEAADDIQEKTQDAVEELHDLRQNRAKIVRVKAQKAMEEIYERRQDTVENVREHIEDLKRRYSELNQSTGKVTKRLLCAFPSLESRRHKERVSEIRRQLKEKQKK